MWHLSPAQSQLVKDLIPGPEGLPEIRWAATGANGIVFSAPGQQATCNVGVTDGTQAGTSWIGCEPHFTSTFLYGSIGGQVIFSTLKRDDHPFTLWASDGSTASPVALWQEPAESQNYLRLPNVSQLVEGKACGVIHDNRNDLTVIATDGTPTGTEVVGTLPSVFGHVLPYTIALEDQWLLTLRRRVNDQETVTRYLADPAADTLILLDQEIVPHRTILRQWLIGGHMYELYHVSPSASESPLSWVNWRRQDSLSDVHRIDLTGDNGQALLISAYFPRENGLLFLTSDSQAGHQLWELDHTGLHPIYDFSFGASNVVNTWALKDQLYLEVNVKQDTIAYPFPQELYCFSFIDQTLTLPLSVSRARSRSVGAIHSLGDRTLIVASQAEEGTELWVSDGTPAGTKILDQFWPGLSNGIQPQDLDGVKYGLTVIGGVAYFPVAVPGRGTELGRSDGTPEGTYLVSEDMPGFGSGYPEQLIPWKGGVLYQGRDRASGREWRFLSPDTPPVTAPAASFGDAFGWMELIDAMQFNNENGLYLADMQANGQGDVLLSTFSRRAIPAFYFQNGQVELPDATQDPWLPQSWLSRFGATGDLKWTKRLPQFRDSFGNQMALSEDGTTYLAITTARTGEVIVDDLPPFSSPDGLLLRLDGQGKAEWGKAIRAGNRLKFYQVRSHSTGVWVLGESSGNPQLDGVQTSPERYSDRRAFLWHLSTEGDLRWEQTTVRAFGAWDIALSEDGRTLYTMDADTITKSMACGRQIGGFWLTSREAATGAVRWRQRIDGRLGYKEVSIVPRPQGGVWFTATMRGETWAGGKKLVAEDCDTRVPYVLTFSEDGSLISARIVQHPLAEPVDEHYALQMASDGQGGYWWLGYDSKRDRSAGGPAFSYPLASGEAQLILEQVDAWDHLVATRRFRSLGTGWAENDPHFARMAYGGDQLFLTTKSLGGFDTVALASTLPGIFGTSLILAGMTPDQVSSAPDPLRLIEVAESPWLIGPNPTQGILYLYPQQEIFSSYSFTITDAMGRVVKRGTQDGSQRVSGIDMGNLSPGIFLLQVEGGGARMQEKIMLQK